MKATIVRVMQSSLVMLTLFTHTLRADADCSSKKSIKQFQHNIQLQLSDANGFPVENTQFWVTLDIIKNGPQVTIQLPVINFQSGQNSTNDPFLPPIVPGGYLYTVGGFLPEEIRPTSLVPISIVAASNNGLSPVFSFTQTATSLPVPPPGYIVQITNAGALQVQGAGTFGNVVPVGPQIVLPSEISYVLKPRRKLCANYVLSSGATDITKFTLPFFADHGFRDSQINDAFENVVAWVWADNSNIPDKTNNTLNAMVLIGRVNADGTLSYGQPVQLTDLEPNQMVWDTAVAINRTNTDNIVVSFQLIDGSIPSTAPDGTPFRIPYRSVSFDGGINWETGPVENIITPIQGGIWTGDNRGVSSDAFGNIWYSTSQFYDENYTILNQSLFAVSTDQGVTFERVYIVPPVEMVGQDLYDYPQYCFGGSGDADNSYGLWFTVDYFRGKKDIVPTFGFIPIAQDVIGTGSTIFLNDQINTQELPTIAASRDGRVWVESLTDAACTYIAPVVVRFKSPGALNANYAGVWDMGFVNQLNTYSLANQISFPKRGYIAAASQSIIYDEVREALYALYAAQNPDYSQNMRIYFVISRNNGLTWSEPIEIASTEFANRGYQSMALDTATGNLIFGWYDGRNDQSYQSVEYMAAVIPASKLDALVNSIPLSDPRFITLS